MAIVVDLRRIPEHGARVQGEEPGAMLGLEQDREVRPTGPVRYDLSLQVLPGELIARGSIGVDVEFLCCRCAEPMAVRVEEREFMCVREIAPDDELVDLTEEVRESTILAFPTYPVCSPTCKGLCSTCGANLNRGQCGCTPPRDDRWRGLDALTGIE